MWRLNRFLLSKRRFLEILLSFSPQSQKDLRNQKSLRGFTFLEIVVSLTLIAVGIVGLLETLNVSIATLQKARKETIGVILARSLLSEIITKDFCDPEDCNSSYLGFEDNETRCGSGSSYFDDVDDYQGYSESPPEKLSCVSFENLSFSGAHLYSGFTRLVNVSYVDETLNYTQNATQLKRITVIVSAPGIKNITVVQIKANESE